MDIVLNFSKGAIILKAKDETYLSARSILSDKENTPEQRYNLQAGDNTVHERKLLNSLELSVSEFKSEMYRYNISDTMNTKKDKFTMTMQVSDRFLLSRTVDVERLVGEYLYRKIVSYWWQANYPDMATSYMTNVSVALDNVKKCLSLENPYSIPGGLLTRCICRYPYRAVQIYKEALMNEIHTEMLKLSRSMTDEKGLADINLQTNEMDSETILSRYINRHIKRAGSRMSSYLVDLRDDFVDTNFSERTPIYEYVLNMPKGWDPILFEQLAEEIHSYVVNASLFEWLKTVHPNVSAVYGQQADAAYDNIKHIVTIRKGNALFKPLQPF